MNNDEFITYFLKALKRGVRTFPGHEYARLCRLAGEDEMAETWLKLCGFEQVSCTGHGHINLVLDSLRKAIRRQKEA